MAFSLDLLARGHLGDERTHGFVADGDCPIGLGRDAIGFGVVLDLRESGLAHEVGKDLVVEGVSVLAVAEEVVDGLRDGVGEGAGPVFDATAGGDLKGVFHARHGDPRSRRRPARA